MLYYCLLKRFAAEVGVKVMTFDNEVELHKIKHCFPSAELVVRIIADDPTATCNVSTHMEFLNTQISEWHPDNFKLYYT